MNETIDGNNSFAINIEEIMKYINNRKKLPILNWKDTFKSIKMKLFTYPDNKLNYLLLLKKVSSKLNHSDFEIKILFNQLIIDLIPFINDTNSLIKNITIKIIIQLLNNSENIEFIVKLAIVTCLESDDWNIRYSSILLLQIVIENKIVFFIDKTNFTKKTIEALIINSKDNSQVTSNSAIEVLIYLIANLPNYSEISKVIKPDIMTEIYNISKKKKSDNKNEIKNILKESSVKAADTLNSKLDKKLYTDSNGFMFGVFPKTVIEEIDIDMSIELRLSGFDQLKSLYEENINNPGFLKYSGSFFSFIIKYSDDQHSSISLTVLEIINRMLSTIPGVTLVTNIHHSIPILTNSLGKSLIGIRNKVREIFDKIVMIIPTSQLIPYFVSKFNSDNWILITECVEILNKIFIDLGSIYNDIDFSGNSYDVTIFLEVVKLFDHNTPKVSHTAKKLIKYVGEKVIDTDNFLKTIEYYVSQDVFRNIEILFKIKTGNNSWNGNKNFKKEIASNRVINMLNRESINLDDHETQKYENFVLYKKIVNYENQIKSNQTNIDEDLMDANNKEDIELGEHSSNPSKNYQNFNLENQDKNILTKEKRKINRSRLKRYNDPNDHNIEEKYDKNYNYEYKAKETLSPLKYPESVFQNVYAGLKSNLNWEKQYKCLDHLRKIMYYNPEIIAKETYMSSLIVDEVLNLTASIRSLLVKNTLVTLSEIFQTNGSLINSKYESIFKILTKKINDKNEFISQEANKCLDQLVSNCDISKASIVVVDILTKYTSADNVLFIVTILTKMIFYHSKNFLNNKNFNKGINYVSDIFHKMKNNHKIQESLKNYFKALRVCYNNDEEFERFLNKYYGYETLNKILVIAYD